MLLSENLKPDWGKQYEIADDGTVLDPGGPVRRRLSDKQLLPEVIGIRRLVYIALISDEQWKIDYGSQKGTDINYGSVFQAARMGPLVIRVRISDSAVQIYFDRYSKNKRYDMEHLSSLLLPNNPDMVTTKTVRDYAQFDHSKIILMYTTLGHSVPIPHADYHQLMGPLKERDRPHSE